MKWFFVIVLFSTVDEIPDEAKMNATFAYNTIADDNNSRLKGIFIRLYCQISVLFFISIKVGYVTSTQ